MDPSSSGLLYDIGTKSRSKKVHGMLFGIESLKLRPANMETRFRFDCKRLGNCCRGRHMLANRIVGRYQVGRILDYCNENRIAAHSAVLASRTYILLSGNDRGEVKGVSTLSASDGVGIAHIGGARGYDCQFLTADNLCAIHPVKPLICKFAPVGLVFEHLEYGGRLLFAIQEKQECAPCMKGREWTVGEWLRTHTTVEEFDSWIEDVREDAGYPRLKRKGGADGKG